MYCNRKKAAQAVKIFSRDEWSEASDDPNARSNKQFLQNRYEKVKFRNVKTYFR